MKKIMIIIGIGIITVVNYQAFFGTESIFFPKFFQHKQNKKNTVLSNTEIIINDREFITEKEMIDSLSKNTNQSGLITEKAIIDLVNKERTSRGLSKLSIIQQLERSAEAKNDDMIAYQYFDHESPKDSQKAFSYFITKQNYEFIRVSENLAMGDFTSPQEVVDAWMNSPSHRSNILYPYFYETGVSVQQGTMQGKKVLLITQHFGVPQSACPTVSRPIIETMRDIDQKATKTKKLIDELYQSINDEETASKKTNNTSVLNRLIGDYNQIVGVYNQFAKEFQNISTEYEKQIQQYDNCVKNMN